MRVENIMTRNLAYVHEGDSVQEAAAVMRDENLGFLPVCDEEQHVLGTITDRDIAIRLCADDGIASATAVGAIMTSDVIACSPDADITFAERQMARHCRSRVLVIDEDGRLVGVVSIADVALRDSDKRTAHTLRKIVAREAHL